MARRKYTPGCKQEAVSLAQKSDIPVALVARNAGINDNVLRRRIKEYTDPGKKPFTGHGSPRDEEMAQLKKELQQVKKERGFLKRSGCVLRQGIKVRYHMIQRCRENFPVSLMCRLLNVSTSGYYV